MKSNDQILLSNLDLIDKCLYYGCKHRRQYKDDLRQELCLQILEMDQEKLNELDEEKHLNAYITKMIWRSLNSKTSPFYRQFIAPLVKNENIEEFDFEEKKET